MEVVALIVGVLALVVSGFAVLTSRAAQTDVNTLAGRSADFDGRITALEHKEVARNWGGTVGGGN